MATVASGPREIILDNSPVDFAFIGPHRAHRGVYAKSDGATLDLIALDFGDLSSEIDQVDGRSSISDSAEFLSKLVPNPYRLREELDSHIVRAVARRRVVSEDGTDDRFSEVSFCWRGYATKGELDLIEQIFQEIADDVTNSARRGRTEEFQWQIAPLILACKNSMRRRERYLASKRGIFWLFFVSYLVLGAVMLAALLIQKLFPQVLS